MTECINGERWAFTDVTLYDKRWMRITARCEGRDLAQSVDYKPSEYARAAAIDFLREVIELNHVRVPA